MKQQNPTHGKLLIIYNADEGWTAALMDAAHKILRPESYECSLCMISYGAVSMKREWRDYLNRLPQEKLFFHRQDFARAYPEEVFPTVKDLDLPAILLEQEGRLEVVLGNQQLDRITDVQDLIAATTAELDRLRTTKNAATYS